MSVHGGAEYCDVCRIKYRKRDTTPPCSTCPNKEPNLGPITSQIMYIYGLVSAFREGMSGGINPIILKDVLDSLELESEERLLIYECMRDIVELENKNKNREKSAHNKKRQTVTK